MGGKGFHPGEIKMNAKFRGLFILAFVCMLAVAVSPVSAGTGYDENTNKALTGSNGSGGGAGNTGEKSVDNYNTKPVQYRQNESVANYNTKPVEYRQNGDVDNYNTKPVEYCQNKSVEDCNGQANCQGKPISEYKMPEISEVEFSDKDFPPNYKDEASGEYSCDEITTSTESAGNDDFRKDAISKYLDEKWEEIKRMIIDAILSGKI